MAVVTQFVKNSARTRQSARKVGLAIPDDHLTSNNQKELDAEQDQPDIM